jgi:hypothetical protein
MAPWERSEWPTWVLNSWKMSFFIKKLQGTQVSTNLNNSEGTNHR